MHVTRRLVVVGRLLGAGLTAAMGWIHLQLWVDGFREVPVVGTLFLLNAIGAAVLAVVLLVVPVRLLSAAAAVTAVFTAGTLAGLILSLTGPSRACRPACRPRSRGINVLNSRLNSRNPGGVSRSHPTLR